MKIADVFLIENEAKPCFFRSSFGLENMLRPPNNFSEKIVGGHISVHIETAKSLRQPTTSGTYGPDPQLLVLVTK